MNHIEKFFLKNLEEKLQFNYQNNFINRIRPSNVECNEKGLRLVCRKKGLSIFIKEFVTVE